MASTITPKLLENLLSSFRYELACGGDTHTAGSSASLARTDLDRELEVIQRTPDSVAAHELARQIRSRLNQFSLLHRLPTELISTIFHFVVESDTLEGWPAKHAVRISSVSRLWREIATETCATLWTRLDPLPSRLLDLFLSRSGTAPLAIAYEGSYSRNMLPYIHRWGICRVQLYTSEEPPLQELSVPAPQLEVLRFDVGPRESISYLNLFCGVTPRLREIYIDFSHIPMSCPIFRGLTGLHLYCIAYREPNPIDQLLGILELCPLMKSISFTCLVFPTLPIAPMPGPLITLRYLQNLDLEEGRGQSRQWARTHFLPRIIVPNSCTLDIGASVRWGDDLRHLLPQRSDFLPNLSDIQPVRVLDVSCWGERSSCVRGKTFVSDRVAFVLSLERFGEPDGNDDRNAFPRTISSIGRALPLPLLEEVALSQSRPCDSDPTSALKSFFRIYPSLRIVRLRGHWPWSSILDLFVVTPTRQLCPLLQDLWLAPDEPLDGKVLLEVVKSRTAPEVDSPHLCGVAPLQHVYFDPNHERPSSSVRAALRTYVTASFKAF
ncbi:hypothetical protein BOTBODRAFT_191064 [Botryobasidium botryosum FD-172 SS1]|uniref:F-box domain-containing protein n=1 Tax=Botryobasidium botryosum (strain FD-172 SS1) TaxID=930990 RepID=A0A067MCX9_BOTB1|nr:hypothetical protein BOTBODRAFT_191064 [Botryobasidium botryosum FD-172 SS1]